MNDRPKVPPRGLLAVYTGNGKGKTTAALGLCVRAAGYNHKVAVVQFVKGSWHYGEMDGIKRLAPEVTIEALGKGFVGIVDDKLPREEHEKAARATLDEAARIIAQNKHQIVILDEINVALSLGLLQLDAVMEVLQARPDKMHIVCTGRDAPEGLIAAADLVTEMKEIKHPFQQGMMAQRGFDF